ncbi:MAG TPA: GvpL/GvpF family gas vesicle protein [Thermoguttaceae bacterium]|nr:GvpL/GvpF family gas vesicle protein [Thermoguttaceae bacterium]
MKTHVSTRLLYPVGIVRSRDVAIVAGQTMVGQVAVRWVFADELACAAINASEVPPKPLEHVLALDAIHRWITVLPIRFGTSMTDEEGVCRLLQEQRQELLECLDRVEGTFEIGLRITPSMCQPAEVRPPARVSSSADYLADRRALYQREDRLSGQAGQTSDRYVCGLDGLYQQWRLLGSSLPVVIRLAFLVERDRVDLFRERVKTLRDAREGELCEFLGPWPPYSFV